MLLADRPQRMGESGARAVALASPVRPYGHASCHVIADLDAIIGLAALVVDPCEPPRIVLAHVRETGFIGKPMRLMGLLGQFESNIDSTAASRARVSLNPRGLVHG